MLSVNYNPSVLKAQNNLANATNSVSSALERMSTGFRINSASDDAAGLYVATGLDTQIRGSKQAQKNVADGISLLNIAEGSLSNMKNMLQRVRDLGVQGANSVYDSSARQAMQDEAQALIEEVLRVQEATVFNGRSIFASAVGTNSIASASWKVNTASNSLQSPSILSLGEGVDSTSSITPLSTDVIPSGYTAIYTADDLNNIRNDLSGKYILMNDIDLSGYANWDPIGDDSNYFEGVFDGNGHVIKNLKINKENDYSFSGLFSISAGEIKNVGIENANIKAILGGALAGGSMGKITNCYSTGNIEGTYVGGLIYQTGGEINNCYSSCKVTGSIYAGGLIAVMGDGNINNCYATGEVITKYDPDLNTDTISGGLITIIMSGKLSNSYSSGTVTGGTYGCGGLVGNMSINGKFTQCFSTSKVIGEDEQRSGALVGYNENGEFSDSNWSSEKSGLNVAMQGNGTSTNVKKLTATELIKPQTLLDINFDESIWDFSQMPPTLRNMPKAGQGNNTGGTNPDNPGGGTNTGGNGNPQGFGNIRLQVGANADAAANSIYIDLTFDIGNIDVDFSNSESCLDVIESADELLDKISTKISEIGAVTNRLESVQKSQITQIENFTAAKSTIMDADIAQESAEFVKSQILQRTTSALLTQAQNLYSSSILSLIR